MRIALLLAASALCWVDLCWVGAAAGQVATPPVRLAPSCRAGVMHVALLSPAQMCPRPLATALVARPQRHTLHT